MTKNDSYAVFRLPDYRFLISGLFLMATAQKLQAVAIGWDIYERTGSAMAIGWVGVATFVPVLLLFLPAGQAADRYDRRFIMMLSCVLSALAACGLAWASYSGASVGWIYFAVVAGSAAQAISRPARSAIIPNVVPLDLVSRAMTWSTGTNQIAFISGPALAGLMIAATGGATAVYVLVVILNLVGFLGLAQVRHRARADTSGSALSLQHLLAGLVHVWKTRVILGAISIDLLAVLFGGAIALLPVYAKDILEVGPAGLGWLAAAPAIGVVVSAAIQAHLPPSQRTGMVYLWSVAGFGIATVIFGWSTSFWLSLVALFATGALDGISMVIRSTLVATHTPDALRGRVSAVNNVFISSSNELGAFESGFVAALTTPVFAVVSGGIITIALVVLGARMFPEMAKLKSMT